jgi:hypothetical protein
MNVFQFGLEATSGAASTQIGSGDLFAPALILGVVILGWLLYFVLLIVRIFLRRSMQAKNATFKHVTIMVTVPKFVNEQEGQSDGTREQVIDKIAAAESFFSSIAGFKRHKGFKAWLFGRDDGVSFEIVVRNKMIYFYISVPKKLQELLEQQLSSAYPNAHIEEVEDYNIFKENSVIVSSYLKYKRPDAFPIKTYKKSEKDPLNALTNVLGKVPDQEGAAYQFIVRPTQKKWRKRGMNIVRNMQKGMSMSEAVSGGKKSQFDLLYMLGMKKKEEKTPEPQRQMSEQEKEAMKNLEEKVSKGGFEVTIRLIASGRDATSAQHILSNMLNAFVQFNIYEYGNAFTKVVPYSKKRPVLGFIHRAFDEKMAIILNTEEMASLWHLPLPWTETPNIKWLGARRGPVPVGIPRGPEDGGTIELGYNVYRGVKTPVWMKEIDRTRHMYLVGKSGTGKSQYIARLAIQDIRAGHGVCVLDPHGDLAEQVLGNIPKERIDDVVYFNPSDLDRPMGLNMLEAKTEQDKDFAAQEMISIFYKLFPPEMIGPMFEHHMRNVMLTLMSDVSDPGSLIEIPRMFSDEEFQKKWRKRIKDPVVNSYWVNEVDKTSDFHKSEMLGYLISKVGRFVENEMMRNIIGQQRSSFDFREIMDKKKILIVNLSKGKTGDVNSELLGMIIVTKLQMAALGRADMPEEDRHDFYLYIDEFQNFITDSIATILSEARKYRLNLILAHQYVGQLVKHGKTETRDAVFGNVGTNFVARIGPEDVDILGKMYSPNFTGYDLINSDKFTWYVKMIVDNSQQKPFTLNSDPYPSGDRELANAIRELSRLKHGRAKDIVEAEIAERAQLGTIERQSEPAPPTGL